MSTTVQTRIKLRNDSEENFNKVASTLIPLNGEVLLVKTQNYGVLTKIGDGTTVYKDLKFVNLNETNTVKLNLVKGYYKDNEFFASSNYTVKLNLYETQLYVDLATNYMYLYNASTEKLVQIVNVPTATDSTAGIIKLYNSQGQNTDGAMSQKATTNAINEIYFAVEKTEGSTSDEDYTLLLHKPW